MYCAISTFLATAVVLAQVSLAAPVWESGPWRGGWERHRPSKGWHPTPVRHSTDTKPSTTTITSTSPIRSTTRNVPTTISSLSSSKLPINPATSTTRNVSTTTVSLSSSNLPINPATSTTRNVSTTTVSLSSSKLPILPATSTTQNVPTTTVSLSSSKLPIPPATSTAAAVTTTSVVPTTPAAPSAGAWWRPAVGATWQYEIGVSSPSDTTTPVSAFDIDLEGTTAASIAALHSAGKKVICYFSAGTFEDWRSDASKFAAADKGDALPDWPGESWLNTKSANVRSIMTTRIQSAVTKGCDGVEPDNMDAYNNGGGGFGLQSSDALDYIKFLATTAHGLGLAIGLKNSGNIVSTSVSLVDFAVNEQCIEYEECAVWVPFITAGKPVFHVEYPSQGAAASANVKTVSCDSPTKFASILKDRAVTAAVYICPPH